MKKTMRVFLAMTLMLLTLCMLPAIGKSTASVTVSAATEGWKQDSNGWWYQKADGTYPKNQWYKISGKWYHFNASGYMQTGWLKLNDKWFYLGSNGAMRTGWQQIDGKWYLFNKANQGYDEGEMFHNTWWNVDGVKYWFTSSGAMATGWQKALTEKNTMEWFYFTSGGKMKTGWQKIGGYWYYLNEAMYHDNVYKIGDSKYLFDANGHMKTGWQQWKTTSGSTEWFYFESNGAMHLGWLHDGGHWYYMSESMVHPTSGIGYMMIDGTKYYFNAKGWLVDASGKETTP